MSRQLEQGTEAQQARRGQAILKALDHGLADAVGRSGGDLVGFSVKLGFHDCLLVVKAVFPGGRMIAFVGSESLGGALIKAVREGNSDSLRWREDKYAGKGS